MAAPLPTGSSIRALPVAPDINVSNMVANVDPMANMQKGIDFAGQFARLGQLRSKMELEDLQRKADASKAKAMQLESDILQRELEKNFTIKQQQEQAQLALLQQSLANAKTTGSLAAVQLGEAEGTAGFNRDMRSAASAQLKALDVPSSDGTTPAPAAPAAPVEGIVEVPFKPNADFAEWIKPQITAKIVATRAPVMSVSSLAKELGVKPEKRTFTDPKGGGEYEADVLVGPAGEIFKVSSPRFVKASAMQAKVDADFASDVAEFNSGGAVKMQANISKLDNAIKVLRESGTIGASGPIVGLIPEKVRKPFTTDKTMAIQKDVEQVVQESLKMILGAQFAQKEAEQLLARAFDTSLSEQANADRVEVLKNQLQNAFTARAEAVDHFRRHGTLAGFTPPAQSAPKTGDIDSGLKPTAQDGEIVVLTAPQVLPNGQTLPAGTRKRRVTRNGVSGWEIISVGQ